MYMRMYVNVRGCVLLIATDCQHFASSRKNNQQYFQKETEFKFKNKISKISLITNKIS